MVPDNSTVAKPKTPEKIESPPVLAKEWQTVDKFTWLNRIRRLPLNASQKHLLHAMAVYANPDGSNVFASIKTLAGDMSMDRKTVNGHVIKLREAGWLIAEGRIAKFNRTLRYRINIEKILRPDADNSEVIETEVRGVTPLSKAESLPGRKRHNASTEGGKDTVTERGVDSLPDEAQRPTTKSSYQTNQTRSDLPDHHHHPAQATPDDDPKDPSDALKSLYFTWREKSITKGVLKVLQSEEASIAYWKARLEPGQGKRVKNPTAYLRKCLNNDPPEEFIPPAPAHKKYSSGEWADYIES